MRDNKALIAAVERDITESERTLAELERLAEGCADLAPPALTDEMRELFERLEAMNEAADFDSTRPLPLYGIRI